MRALKSEQVKGTIDNKKSTFTVEIVKNSDGFEVIYSDNKGWGIGFKKYKACDSISEASAAYTDLIQLIQI